jgi:hypothetical protein
LARCENAISIRSLQRLRDVFIDQFIASFDTPPRPLTFDLDAIADPAHGHQQLTFGHGYYDQNQYLPLVITCADNDPFVMLSLRPGNAQAALGADDDLAYLVRRLRQVWPDVLIFVRGDGGFGIPAMYDVCESLAIFYTFGLSTNAILKRETAPLLATAAAAYAAARQAALQQERSQPAEPSRLFTGFWYAAGPWRHKRYVVAKAAANAQGTNQRFVVTHRPGAALFPEPTYDAYAARGARENRNKEFKGDLALDRLSDHRFVANYFRLYVHAAALNLLVQLRRFVAEPAPVAAPPPSAPATPASETDETAAARHPPQTPATATTPDVPVEALTGAERRRHFCLRRQRDPLGEGHPCTWRTLLIKVAAEVVVSARRVVARLSSSWPHLDW